ncbi:phosphotransferase-like protein [Actinophytocola algeriensis]|uniref:phosphotransferase-like protein n=1 Tax=Actinophytocola algeriensis TaxID=1768010 RepID=UPI002892C94C|nr:hypothetical protein [Actinophytocola algeriensis]
MFVVGGVLGEHPAPACVDLEQHVDELLLTPDLLPTWMDALSGLEVLLVRVTCPLVVAEQRERARRNPSGLARGHYRMVHDHGTTYDMTVDSTTGTPAELARAVLRRQLVR